MIKAFLDTNVLLDTILRRDRAQFTDIIINDARDCKIHAYTSAISILDIVYILQKRLSLSDVKDILKDIFKWCNILPSGDNHLFTALNCDCPDYEDNIQILCAEEKGCDLIITSNLKHFKDYTEILVLSPEEYLKV